MYTINELASSDCDLLTSYIELYVNIRYSDSIISINTTCKIIFTMQKKKLFVEDAHPILCFFLKMVGLMHCGRDEKGEYTIYYRRSIAMVITVLLLIMSIIFHCFGIFRVEYFVSLSFAAYILSCIYLLLSIYQTFLNRKYKLKYLQLIGSSFEGSATFHQRMMVGLEWSIYIGCAGLLNVSIIPGAWILILLWYPVFILIPCLLDNFYKILLEPLLKSYASLNSEIKKNSSLELENTIYVQELRPMRKPENLQMAEVMIKSRMQQLITRTTLFYKVSIFL